MLRRTFRLLRQSFTIESDPEATPPLGRGLVNYDAQGDALFDSPVAKGGTYPADVDLSDAANDEGLPDALDLSMLSMGGDAGTLLAQLERMADDFEKQSGEPETEIRSKIAMLRSVLDARPAEVDRSRLKMDAAVRSIEAQEHAPAAADALVERAAESLCAGNLASMEANMEAMSSMLREDPDTAAMVAAMLSTTSK